MDQEQPAQGQRSWGSDIHGSNMEALCIRHDNGKKHVYHALVKQAILEVP
jgi:hypothetical protein